MIINKIQHNLEFPGAYNLNWYTGLYLGIPKQFTKIIKRKLVQNASVTAVLVPIHTVKDPVTQRNINIHIMDRYFFIGTKNDVMSEQNIGLHTSVSTITLLRNRHETQSPSKISPKEINQVIYTHRKMRRDIIQEDVSVFITEGTFKNWYGIVQERNLSNPEIIKVKFNSDDYDYIADMPTALCKASC